MCQICGCWFHPAELKHCWFSIASVSLEMSMDSQLKEETLQIMLRVNLLQPKEIS